MTGNGRIRQTKNKMMHRDYKVLKMTGNGRITQTKNKVHGGEEEYNGSISLPFCIWKKPPIAREKGSVG